MTKIKKKRPVMGHFLKTRLRTNLVKSNNSQNESNKKGALLVRCWYYLPTYLPTQ